MDEITFSIFNHSPAASTRMAELLKEFEREENVHVRLEVIPWVMGWQKLVEMGLYRSGADISEVGSTWTMDLVRMEALRAYSESEAEEITHGRMYFDSAWTGGVSRENNQNTIWAIPLAGDARAVYYRRDWLQKAGVNEEQAFQDQPQFELTLTAIQEAGCAAPLALPLSGSRNNLHSLASWVWGQGGEFLSADGTRIEFEQPAAANGFKTYFKLGKYFGSKQVISDTEADNSFLQGKSAVTISGYSLLAAKKSEEVAANLGVATLPGMPFVGGEHLVIWKHARHPEHVLRLAKFLARPESREYLYPLFGLPVTADGWDRAPFNTPHYLIFRDALQHGRSFPASRLWGLVEKRLSETLGEIWTEVLVRPEQINTITENYLGSLAKRLQTTIRG